MDTKRQREGQTLVCGGCGAEVVVVKDCECDDCGIICCGKPMEMKPERRSDRCCCS